MISILIFFILFQYFDTEIDMRAFLVMIYGGLTGFGIYRQNQLKELTGLNDMNEIEQYIANKSTELNGIMQDLAQVSNTVNSQYTFSENDVQMLKGIVDKYNIPIGE